MNILDKLMTQEKRLLKKVSKNTTYLKIISLLVAIVLFISLNGTSFLGLGDLFETEKYIPNINVNIVKDDGKIVTGIPSKIGVNIKGSEVDVQTFEENAQNITASINLAGREDGEYDVSFEEFKFSQDYGVEVIPLVNEYNVTIDTSTDVTMPVSIEYINKEKHDSLLLTDYDLDSPTVTFEAGQMQKEVISSAKVILDISEIDTSLNETEHVFEETVKVYDVKGELMDFEDELPKVKVTQEYEIKTILMPVKYKIINNSTNQYVSYVCKEQDGATYDQKCQDQVEVYGDEEVIQELGYITYNVDLSDFSAESPIVIATPSLENGVFVEEEKGYNVKVGTDEGVSKTFKNIPIVVENLNDDLEIVNNDSINLDVKVTGAKSIIDSMTKDDFEVFIDASDITTPNVARMPLQVNINNLITYELSEKEVSVEFKEKE